MAKKFPNIETLKVYQQGGDNEPVRSCPAATTDSDLNLDNRERSITRSNYTKADSKNKCGNCIFFDISSRMKKCMDTKTDNTGYCWDQEFVCSKDNVCDMWEEGGPIKSDESSYIQDKNYNTEYEENKAEVEQIQAANQSPIANQPPQQQMPPQGIQQMMAPQGPPPQGPPPQAMAPPQQEVQPTYKYGGSLRKAQQQEETQITFKDWVLQDPVNRQGPNAKNEYIEFIKSTTVDPTFGTDPSTQSSSVNEESSSTSTVLDNNTDIYDANNPDIKERGNTLKDVFPWMTNKGIKRRGKYGQNRDENFIPWEADPTTDIGGLGSIANWFKSVVHDERNLDVDPNKITNREFRRYKKHLRKQNPNLSRKEIREMANEAFPSHGNNRWGKEHYQQFKVTNPFSETRFFDPENPDELLTHGEKQAQLYNEFSQNRVAMYPELYQVSSMDNDGNITYTGDKLLGDMEETEYMPNSVHIVHTDDNKGIKGSWIYSGTSDDGQKEYEFIPFDLENPTRKTTTNSTQKNANDCITLKQKCLGAEPAGTWDADSCTCTYNKESEQEELNKNVKKDANIDDIVFPENEDYKTGGAAPTFAFMRDGGDLRRFQNTSEHNWTDQQILDWINLQNKLVRPRMSWKDDQGYSQYSGSKFNPLTAQEEMIWDPRNIDLTQRSTWPSLKYSEFDPAWSGINNLEYPWLPDFSTEEGRSAAYNLHRTAAKTYPDDLLMPDLYWGTNPSGDREAYPYNIESRSEKDKRTGKVISAQLTEFNEKIKNVKSKTELKKLMSNTDLNQQSIMYILNQANQNNDLDISDEDYISIMDEITTFQTDPANKSLYEHTAYGPGEKVDAIVSRDEWGNTVYNTDYQYNPHTYEDFTMANPNIGQETTTKKTQVWIDPDDGKWYYRPTSDEAWYNTPNFLNTPCPNDDCYSTYIDIEKDVVGSTIDDAFRDQTISENKKGEKLTQPTQVWDEHANNGEGGWISIDGTLTNADNQGDRAERLHIGQILKDKGIITDDMEMADVETIIDNFAGGVNSRIWDYKTSAFDNIVPASGINEDGTTRLSGINPKYKDFIQTFGNSTFQEYSNTNPNQPILSKQDALHAMTLRSHYNNTEKLPSEIYGNKTGTYNPHIEGMSYFDEESGENVWVDNPEYNSKFAKGVRGDFKGGFTDNYESAFDYFTDAPVSTTLGHIMSNKDVQYALNNPMHTFGPLAMEAGPLLRGAGALANYTRIAPLMNTGVFGTNITPWNAINTGFGIDMATHIPDNLENENYGMAILNTLGGVSSGANILNKLNTNQALMPTSYNTMKNWNPNLPALNSQGAQKYTDYANYINELPAISLRNNPSQFSAIKNFSKNFNPNIKLTAPKLNYSGPTITVPPGGFMEGGSLPKAQIQLADDIYYGGLKLANNATKSVNLIDKTNPWTVLGTGSLYRNSGIPSLVNINNRDDLLKQYQLRNDQYRTVNINDKVLNNTLLRDNAFKYGFNADKADELAAFMGTTPTLGDGRRAGYESLLRLDKDILYTGDYPHITNSRYTTGNPQNAWTVKSNIWEDDISLLDDQTLFDRISLLDNVRTHSPKDGIFNVGDLESWGNINQIFDRSTGLRIPHGSLLNTQTTNVPELMQTNLIYGDAFKPVRKPISIFRGDDLNQSLKLSGNRFETFAKGGQLPRAQMSNGAEDVAALYQVNPEQFDYDTNMPKEGAISAYGDVWQGGQWVDATQDQHGFNTPDSDQFGVVGSAFSDETGIINRNTNFDPNNKDKSNPFLGNEMNQLMKSAAADTYDVRRRDINKDTWNPKEGSINKSYGDIWNDETGWTDNQFTPQFDVTDDFAFEGDDNTLSRGQLRDVRKSNRRQEKAEKKGFSSWDEMQEDKTEKRAIRKAKRKAKRDRWGDTFGQRMGNKFRYMMDSKAMQRFGNYSQAAVKGAGLINDGFDIYNENKAADEIYAGRTAGSMYGVTPTSALSKGEEDELTGIFQTSDKVIARQDGRAQSGAELPRHQFLGGVFGNTVRDSDKYDWFGGGIGTSADISMDDLSNSNINQESIIPSLNIDAGMSLMTPKAAAVGSADYRMSTDGNVLDVSGGIQFDPTRQYEGHWPSDNISIPWLGYNKWGLNGPYIIPTAGYHQGRQIYDQGDGRNYWKANAGIMMQQDPWSGTCGAGGAGWGCDINADYGTQYSDDPSLSYDASLFYGPLSVGYKSNNAGDYATVGLNWGFKKGGEKEKEKTISIDTDMYYELLAAGADIEII